LFAPTNAEEASEYAALMTILTVKRRSAIGKMGMIMAACAGAEKLVPYASLLKNAIANSEITAATLRFRKRSRPLTFMALRIFGGITSAMSGILMMLLLFSSGGIERDGCHDHKCPSAANEANSNMRMFGINQNIDH
jgi:hypothetical protein